MPDETTIHLFSQLVYLDVPPAAGRRPSVGDVADYYRRSPAGAAYLRARFSANPAEYRSWLGFLETGVGPIRDWRVVHTADENGARESGLYACGYRSPAGDLTVAFRGSEMLGNPRYRNDYETDFALSYEDKTPQQLAAEAYLREFSDGRSGDYRLTGHSLGGNLALHAAVHAPAPDRLIECLAFNAPGFSYGYIWENKRKIKDARPKLRVYQNEHDMVSSLLLNIAKPTLLASAYNPYAQERTGAAELFYPHSNFVFQAEGERFVRCAGSRKTPLCTAVHAFTRLFLLLPRPVRKTLSGMILDAVYSSQPPEKQLVFLMERVTKYLVRGGVADLGKKGLAISGCAYLAQDLLRAGVPEEALLPADPGGSGKDSVTLARTGLLLLRIMQRLGPRP